MPSSSISEPSAVKIDQKFCSYVVKFSPSAPFNIGYISKWGTGVLADPRHEVPDVPNPHDEYILSLL